MNQGYKTNPVQGTIKSAELFKPGGKVLKVVIETMKGDFTFRAWDSAYLQKVGQDGEFNCYTKDNTYNGKTEKQWWLQDLTPRKRFANAQASGNLEQRIKDLELGQTALFAEIQKLKEQGTGSIVAAARAMKEPDLAGDLAENLPF